MYFLAEQIMISFRIRKRKKVSKGRKSWEENITSRRGKSEASRVEGKVYVEDLILIWTKHENVRKENVF